MGASLDREPIAIALEARLRRLCPQFVSVERPRAGILGTPDPSQQPCIQIVGGPQNGKVTRGAPTIWGLTFLVNIFHYADEGDTSTPRETAINQLVKAVEDALERQSNEAPSDTTELYATNLGFQFVKSCRMTEISTDEGTMGPQSWTIGVIHVEPLL